MQKLFFTIFLSALSFATVFANDPVNDPVYGPVYGPQEENSCEIQGPFLPFTFDITKLYKTACDEKLYQKKEFYKLFKSDEEHEKDNKDRYCQCLSDVADGNILVSTRLNRLDDSEEVKAEIDEVKRDYFDRFYSVYDQMTMGASIQEKILKIDNTRDSAKGVIGCSPESISTEIQTKIKENVPLQMSALSDLLSKSEVKLKHCKKKRKNCHQDEQVVQRIKLNMANLNAMDPCYVQLTVIKSRLMNFSKDGSFRETFEALTSENKRSILSRVNGALDLENFNPTQCNFVVKSAMKKIDEATEGSEELFKERKGQCGESDAICNIFEEKNTELANEMAKNFAIGKDDCFNRAEYMTFQSMPGKDLLNALASARNPAHLLKLPSRISSPMDALVTRFLRSNPIIAKMASNEKLRDSLGEKFKSFATKVQSKGTADTFKDYLSFMKNDVKNILQDEPDVMKSTEAFVCEEMTNNFSAISIANDLPNLEDKQNYDDNLGSLFKQIDQCSKSRFNMSASTDIKASLETSPIFNLGLSADEQNKDEKNFQDLKDKVCKGYAEACPTGDEKCRENFLSTTGAEQVPETMEPGATGSVDTSLLPETVSTVVNSDVIDTEISKEDIEKIRESTDKTKQDKTFWNWWHENIGSKLSNVVIATRGSEKKFRSTRAADARTFSHTTIPQSVGGGQAYTQQQHINSSNPGQVIPRYKKDSDEASYFQPAKLKEGSKVTSAIQNYNSLSPEQKISNLQEAKSFMQQNSWPTDKIAESGINEELKKANETLEEEIEKSKKLENVNTSISKQSQGASPSRSPSSVGAGGSFGPASSGSSAAPSRFSSSVKTAKFFKPINKKKTLNDVLVEINEQSSLDIKEGVIDPKEFNGPQSADAEIVVDNEDYFNLLVEDTVAMDSFIRKELSGVEIGESKIVSISSKTSVNPMPQLIFRVKHKKDGGFEIQSLPPQVAVKRVSTLKILQLQFKN
jgi:hypothetical protein